MSVWAQVWEDITMVNMPFWAELHNHNAVGYARGSLTRSYAIARGALLDVFCFTPHGPWHDMPTNDPTMVAFHRNGYERVKQQWPRVQAMAERAYEPGRFVTFQGYEWHSSQYGDFHVLFPDDGELFAGDDVRDLQELVRDQRAMMIPHHVGYAPNWRGANWASLDPSVSPVVDVFSEHGCSMEGEFNMPMLRHSMGGSQRSQTVMEQFKAGLVAGVVASTDNHYGHPASYGEGLTGIWADELTRGSVFEALRRRHTYALTGDRIGLSLHLGNAMMGDVVTGAHERVLRYRADAVGKLDYVRLIKNGHAVRTISPPPASGHDRSFVVRIEFGWDAMTSRDVTDWQVCAETDSGRIIDVMPCFAGGAGSVTKVNQVESCNDHQVTFTAYTSRRNSQPTSAVVLRIEGTADTRIDVDALARHKGAECGCKLSGTVAELMSRDAWGAISGVFSAPKIRLGQAHGESELTVAGEWTDPAPHANDWYLLKVQQANGHAAWSSPIWCRVS